MQQRQKLSAKTQKKFALKSFGSSGATSGLSSSLAFTPIQVSTRRLGLGWLSGRVGWGGIA